MPGLSRSVRPLVLDHHDSYTWSLVHLVAAIVGRLPDVRQHTRVRGCDLARYTHVILSPGPGRPDDPDDFSLPLVTAAAIPVFGVCLGMQGIVTAFGGRVARVPPAHGEVSEIHHDGRGVFRGVPPRFPAVRYHSLAATSVPDCLEVTARTADGVVMGVRHRQRPIEGVQFHPESILTEHGRLLVANALGLA